MLQQLAHSSKAGYRNYSQGTGKTKSTGAITRGDHLVQKQLSVLSQGIDKIKATAQYYPQVGDLDGINEESKEECCDLKSTSFVDDACSAMTTFGKPPAMDDVTVKDMSILDFLAKPYLVADLAWTTASVSNSQLGSYPINALLTTNAFWSNKIQGFALYRGTVCFKFAINANPFQAGRLLLHFLPHTNVRTDSSYTSMHNANLVTKTQQPHVELDARDSSAIIKIPYVSPTNFIKAKSSSEYIDWGTLFVTVLSPLVTGAAGSTTVDCALYAWFEDFELAGPTVPQSSKKPGKKFQVKTMSREAVSLSTTPVSDALMHGSRAAASLSSIPFISSIASAASWAMRTASGVASVFGWSKPISEAPASIMSKQYNRYAATSAGIDAAFPLALIPDNKIVATDSVSIRDEDEMSFAFLKSVSSFVTSINWTTVNTSGSSLYSLSVSPQTLYAYGTTTYSTHTTTWRTGPPIFYLSNFFAYWRGSVRVILKIIKTDYHTGRLQVTWTPKGFGSSTSPGLSDGVVAQRWLIDIRDTNVVEIELPWYIATNYLPVSTPSGVLDVLVLNELRVPETAGNSVNILVYYKGGDDFELAGPGVGTTTPYGPIVFSPQAGDEVLKTGPIGDVAPRSMDTFASCLSMGELFCSVKQLLNRYTPILMTTWPSNTTGLSIWPWFIGAMYMNSTTGVLTPALVGGDTLCIIAPMYAMYRGSMKIMHKGSSIDFASGGITTGRSISVAAGISPALPLMNPGALPPVGAPLVNLSPDVAVGTSYYSTNSTVATGVVVSDSGNGVHAFSVPYYCMTKSSLAVVQTNSNLVPSDITTPTTMLTIFGKGSNGSNVDSCIYRAAGDDFQLSYFIGCPPITYSYV